MTVILTVVRMSNFALLLQYQPHLLPSVHVQLPLAYQLFRHLLDHLLFILCFLHPLSHKALLALANLCLLVCHHLDHLLVFHPLDHLLACHHLVHLLVCHHLALRHLALHHQALLPLVLLLVHHHLASPLVLNHREFLLVPCLKFNVIHIQIVLSTTEIGTKETL